MIAPAHKPGHCSACGQAGHTQKKCVQCKLCRGWGHNAALCPLASQRRSRSASPPTHQPQPSPGQVPAWHVAEQLDADAERQLAHLESQLEALDRVRGSQPTPPAPPPPPVRPAFAMSPPSPTGPLPASPPQASGAVPAQPSAWPRASLAADFASQLGPAGTNFTSRPRPQPSPAPLPPAVPPAAPPAQWGPSSGGPAPLPSASSSPTQTAAPPSRPSPPTHESPRSQADDSGRAAIRQRLQDELRLNCAELRTAVPDSAEEEAAGLMVALLQRRLRQHDAESEALARLDSPAPPPQIRGPP